MIIKTISRRSNPGQLINYATRYILKDRKGAKAKEFMKVLITHNLRSKTVENIIKEFKENESYRLHPRKDNATLFHSIISFSPKDKEKITIPMLKDIGMRFVELRGKTLLHLGVVHLEKSHTHLHLVSSGVQTNGKSSRMSKVQFKQLLSELEMYQQTTYPQLSHSKNRHDKITILEKEQLVQNFSINRSKTKALLHENLKAILAKSASFTSFKKGLTAHKYELYYRNEQPQGIILDGVKYRFTSLGIEPAKITSLPAQDINLSDLEATRKKEPVQQISHSKKITTVDNDFEELQQLRSKGKEIEGFERTIEPDSRGMGKSP